LMFGISKSITTLRPARLSSRRHLRLIRLCRDPAELTPAFMSLLLQAQELETWKRSRFEARKKSAPKTATPSLPPGTNGAAATMQVTTKNASPNCVGNDASSSGSAAARNLTLQRP